MAARLALSRADVQPDPDTEGEDRPEAIDAVTIMVRDNVATLSRGGSTVATMDHVTAVEQTSRGVYRVTGSSGVWEVRRRRGGCCGRA